jgi:hypothetical protein
MAARTLDKDERKGRPMSDQTYDAEFISALVSRFHRYSITEADASGLAGMLGPVDALAEAASSGVGFDDEPADFLRVMLAERGRES